MNEPSPKSSILFDSHAESSLALAAAVAHKIRGLIKICGRAVGIFDANPSLEEFLEILIKSPGIEWTRVIGFQLAELIGIDEEDDRSSRRFLYDHMVKKAPIAEFHAIRGEAANPDAVCTNYASLLNSRPPDFAVINVGEAGQIGFLAANSVSLNGEAAVKIIRDDSSRLAISLTIPLIMSCSSLFVFISGEEKSERVLKGPVTADFPASILRTHPDASFFVDKM